MDKYLHEKITLGKTIGPLQEYRSKGYTKEQLLQNLAAREDLGRDEKNFIYLFLFPRPLLDRELPPRVKEAHFQRGDTRNKGIISPNALDVTLILEASQTPQYGRFIKHLMYAFCDSSKLIVSRGVNTYDCPICGKSLLGDSLWEASVGKSDTEHEFLAIGSRESSVTLCIDCISQLTESKRLIEEIDPGFLDWRKRMSNSKT